MKIKTRQSFGVRARLALCRSTAKKTALKQRQSKRMPPRIPDGVKRIIRDIAAEIKVPAPGGGWTASGKKIEEKLRADYYIKVSLHPILDELKAAGYEVARGGRPPNLHTRDRAELRELRSQGLTMEEIGKRVDLSPQRVSALLREPTSNGDTKK